MLKEKIICWWSGGITSAVACKIALDLYGKENCKVIMIDTRNEDEDTYRFFTDCERWYDTDIQVISGIPKKEEKRKNYEFINVGYNYEKIQDVWKRYKSLNVASGAICSTELKRAVRVAWQKNNEYDHQVFGFEFDKKEMNRALSLAMNYPQSKPIFPLLMLGYDKEKCLEIVTEAGIEIPRSYKLGFKNNNPCTLDTKIVTYNGVKKIGDVIGTTQVLLNRSGWSLADISFMGTQPVLNLEIYKKGLPIKHIKFTPDHKWYNIKRGSHFKKLLETRELKVGDILPTMSLDKLNYKLDRDYFLRGVVIGDGSVSSNKYSLVRLFEDKIKMMVDLGYTVKMRKNTNIGCIRELPLEYKTKLPSIDSMSYNERCSLLAGLIATDGSVNIKSQTCLSTSDNKDYFINLIESVGIIVTSCVDNTNFGSNTNDKGVLIKATKPNIIINFRVPEDLIIRPKHKKNFRKIERRSTGWRIKSITLEEDQKVACATIINSDPEFLLQGGILTGNCLNTGCVQGGIGYWQKMKRDFPDKFEAMADVEHELTALKGEPVTMLKDQSNDAKQKVKESGIKWKQLVFLRKHPDYPEIKCIDQMPPQEVKPLFECNGFCGTNDLNGKNKTEDEINFGSTDDLDDWLKDITL